MRSSGSPGVPMFVVAQPASSARAMAPAAARIRTGIGSSLASGGSAILPGTGRFRVRALRLGDFLRAPSFRQVFLQFADTRIEALALHGIDARHGLGEAELVDGEREVAAD